MAAGRTKQLGGERVGDPLHKRLFLPRKERLTVNQCCLQNAKINSLGRTYSILHCTWRQLPSIHDDTTTVPALGTEADKTRPGFTFFRIRAKSDGHTTISIADNVGYVFGLSETGGFHILASGRDTPEGAERARERGDRHFGIKNSPRCIAVTAKNAVFKQVYHRAPTIMWKLTVP